MAKSGSFNSGSYEGRYMKLYWEQTSQSIPNNTTTIKWQLTGHGGSGWYYVRFVNLIIDGTSVFSQPEATEMWCDGRIHASGTATIPHNTDGAKTLNITLKCSIWSHSADQHNNSGSWSLERIPRGATITKANNFNDEQNPYIEFSNPAGAKIEMCLSYAGGVDYVYKTIPGNPKSGSYTYSLTAAERTKLRKDTPGTSRKIRFYLRTTISGSYYYDMVEKTVTIKQVNPTISPTYYDSNSETVAVTKNNKIFIAGYSNLHITAGATAHKEATVTTYISMPGRQEFQTDAVMYSGITENRFTVRAVDSRGFTSSKTQNITVRQYKPLTAVDTSSITLASENKATVSFRLTGTYDQIRFGDDSSTDNNLSCQYRYAINGGSYSSWKQLTVSKNTSNDTYVATASLTVGSYKDTVKIQLYAGDKLKGIYTTERNLKAEPVFEWGKDNFTVNVPFFCNNNFGVNPKTPGFFGQWGYVWSHYGNTYQNFKYDNYYIGVGLGSDNKPSLHIGYQVNGQQDITWRAI